MHRYLRGDFKCRCKQPCSEWRFKYRYSSSPWPSVGSIPNLVDTMWRTGKDFFVRENASEVNIVRLTEDQQVGRYLNISYIEKCSYYFVLYSGIPHKAESNSCQHIHGSSAVS